MNNKEDIDKLLEGIRFDNQSEWIDTPGQWCINKLRELGMEGVQAVLSLIRESAGATPRHERTVALLNAIQLLVAAGTSEAYDALSEVLALHLEDEVVDQLFEDAALSNGLPKHKRFVAAATRVAQKCDRLSVKTFLALAARA